MHTAECGGRAMDRQTQQTPQHQQTTHSQLGGGTNSLLTSRVSGLQLTRLDAAVAGHGFRGPSRHVTAVVEAVVGAVVGPDVGTL